MTVFHRLKLQIILLNFTEGSSFKILIMKSGCITLLRSFCYFFSQHVLTDLKIKHITWIGPLSIVPQNTISGLLQIVNLVESRQLHGLNFLLINMLYHQFAGDVDVGSETTRRGTSAARKSHELCQAQDQSAACYVRSTDVIIAVSGKILLNICFHIHIFCVSAVAALG